MLLLNVFMTSAPDLSDLPFVDTSLPANLQSTKIWNRDKSAELRPDHGMDVPSGSRTSLLINLNTNPFFKSLLQFPPNPKVVGKIFCHTYKSRRRRNLIKYDLWATKLCQIRQDQCDQNWRKFATLAQH